MSMKERYYTIDGQMVGYKKAGVRKDLLTDALGSVTAEVDQTGNTKTFDGRYKPHGAALSSTGSGGSYGWVGTWAYKETGLSVSTHYVRARYYSETTSNWLTIDSFWPREAAYKYVDGRPTLLQDPSGLAIQKDVPALGCSVGDGGCGSFCNGPVVQAACKRKAGPLYPKNNQSIWHLAICCNGVPAYCTCPGIKDSNQGNSILQECTAAHESSHCPPGTCKAGQSKICDPKDGTGTECEAVFVQMVCLSNKCPAGSTNKLCKGARAMLCYLCNERIGVACAGVPNTISEQILRQLCKGCKKQSKR